MCDTSLKGSVSARCRDQVLVRISGNPTNAIRCVKVSLTTIDDCADVSPKATVVQKRSEPVNGLVKSNAGMSHFATFAPIAAGVLQ